MRENINGILLLDKPVDMTSNHALQRVKHLYNAKKAGHTGSLDPIATGMLPICFGEATKFSQFLLESNKTYYVTARLGVETTTGDSEGEIVRTTPVQGFSRETVEQALFLFTGKIKQIPPMYSAIKYKGRPLYELARKGIEIERKPREVQIFSLEMDELTDQTLVLRVHCSKGTYIRTLVEDIGRQLGCGAHVIALRRLSVMPYTEQVMYTLSALETVLSHAGKSSLQNCLLPLETAVEIYPAVKLSTSAAFYIRMGQPVRTSIQTSSHLVRLVSEDTKFLGLGELLPDGRIKPHRLITKKDMPNISILA